MGANEWINKAKDFATGHKDQVQGALDKAEDAVKSKTGDKYTDKINKGRGALEDKLGYTDGDGSGATTGETPGTQTPGAAGEQSGGTSTTGDGTPGSADGPVEGDPRAGL